MVSFYKYSEFSRRFLSINTLNFLEDLSLALLRHFFVNLIKNLFLLRRNAMQWTPLDCAASRGWTWCAGHLLDADSLIDPTDKARVSDVLPHFYSDNIIIFENPQ